MTEETPKYYVPIGHLEAGYKVVLRELGFEEPVIIFKAYCGRPISQDILPYQYDLSYVDPRDERRNFSEEELEQQDRGDMTLIVARKSGDQGVVLYINDAECEVEVIDYEPLNI